MPFISTNNLLRGILYTIVSIYVLSIGVITEPDTGSYVSMYIITPPGYPSFLFVFRKIFGEDNYFWFVLITQLIVSIVSILYLTKALIRSFNLRSGFLVFLDIILLSPLFISEYLVSNRITPEGLAYPFFLLILAFLFQSILEKRGEFLWYFLGALFIGILIRTQFFFVLPVVVIVLGYFWFLSKDFKRFGIPCILILSFPILISLVDKTYHYAVQDHFVNTSNTGVQLMSMPMFVADENDYQIYKDPRKQEYFKHVYKNVIDRQVNRDFYISSFNDNEYRHFHYNYAHLTFGVLSVKGREFLNPSDPGDLETMIENNELLISMWLPLLYDNFSKCARLYYNNLIHAFGGFHMFYLYILILILSLYIYIKHKYKLALFSSVLILYVFTNVILVCLVEHSIGRFFIYHYWVLPVILILAFNTWLEFQILKK